MAGPLLSNAKADRLSHNHKVPATDGLCPSSWTHAQACKWPFYYFILFTFLSVKISYGNDNIIQIASYSLLGRYKLCPMHNGCSSVLCSPAEQEKIHWFLQSVSHFFVPLQNRNRHTDSLCFTLLCSPVEHKQTHWLLMFHLSFNLCSPVKQEQIHQFILSVSSFSVFLTAKQKEKSHLPQRTSLLILLQNRK